MNSFLVQNLIYLYQSTSIVRESISQLVDSNLVLLKLSLNSPDVILIHPYPFFVYSHLALEVSVGLLAND